MIEVHRDSEDVAVLVGGKAVEIVDADADHIVAQCELADFGNESAQALPDNLTLQICSQDGFGTFFFHDLDLVADKNGVALSFKCHTPNKYWEGKFGLATFLAAIREQAVNHDTWEITQIELEDDWKGITLERVVSLGDPLVNSIETAAKDLNVILHAAEVSLSGLNWKEEYTKDEGVFCCELLYPLLRCMGFLFVRYTHGKKEYGKDFTFSEDTPFGHHRHYGLQAKAGDVSGAVNAAIEDLLGQIEDAFAMPYHELGSKDARYISTFIIAISGTFTENAREKIVEKIPKGVIGSVYFLDRERITELVERYWKKQ